jgi:hypothetical protein
MSASSISPLVAIPRKPPAAQYNWISGNLDITPEQIALPLLPTDDIFLPKDNTVTLLATENGSQLFISGFGLFVGKKSERVVVRKDKSVCAQGAPHAAAGDHHRLARREFLV